MIARKGSGASSGLPSGSSEAVCAFRRDEAVEAIEKIGQRPVGQRGDNGVGKSPEQKKDNGGRRNNAQIGTGQSGHQIERRACDDADGETEKAPRDSPNEKRHEDLRLAAFEPPRALAEGFVRRLILEQNKVKRDGPAGQEAQHNQGQACDKSGDGDRGAHKFGRPIGQIVVDVVRCEYEYGNERGNCKERKRDQQNPHDQLKREMQEWCGVGRDEARSRLQDTAERALTLAQNMGHDRYVENCANDEQAEHDQCSGDTGRAQ